MRLLLKGRNFSSLYPFGYKNPMEKETKSMLNITAINNDCSVINSALKILSSWDSGSIMDVYNKKKVASETGCANGAPSS